MHEIFVNTCQFMQSFPHREGLAGSLRRVGIMQQLEFSVLKPIKIPGTNAYSVNDKL